MSIIRPHKKLHLTRIVIALLAPVAATALVPAAAGAGKTTTHRLEFRLSGPGHQDVLGTGAIAFTAHCLTEACTVVASASSNHPSIHSGTVRAHVARGKAATLSLPLAPRQQGKLKAALESGKSPALTVKATAHDSAGNRVPLSLEVHASKP
jgi:hypothetical protein